MPAGRHPNSNSFCYAKTMGIILGITGAIGSGKTTLASFLAQTEPSHVIYEASSIVTEVAQAFNQALKAELAFETTKNDLDLTNQAIIWLPDAISEHLNCNVVWNQLALLPPAVRAQPELYEKLWLYLDLVRKQPGLLDQPITPKNKETYRPLLQWIGGYLMAKISKTIWYDEIFRRIELHEKNTKLVIVPGVRHPSDANIVRQHGGVIVAIERLGTSESPDVTEANRLSITPEITIINNHGIKKLRALTKKLYSDLQVNAIKTTYQAS